MKKRSERFWQGVVIAAAVLSPLFLVAAAQNKAPSLPQGNAKAGKAIFDQNCSLCHFPNQTTTKIGPGLKGLFKNKTLPVSHKPTTVANVLHQVLNGNPSAKPMPMPAFKSKFSKKDLANLIAYLKTL